MGSISFIAGMLAFALFLFANSDIKFYCLIAAVVSLMTGFISELKTPEDPAESDDGGGCGILLSVGIICVFFLLSR